MSLLQIPDEQVAALRARAADEGLTLEAWIAKMSGFSTSGTERIQRKRYKLEDLLAQCDPSAPRTGEDRDWLDAPRAGREII